MKKTLLSIVGVGILLTGCTYSPYNKSVHIAVEHMGTITKREMLQKHLHTHSLMQQLQNLGEKKRFKTIFKPNSDDMFVGYTYPDSWFDAIMDAENNEHIEVEGDIVSTSKRKRVLRIVNDTPTAYDEMQKHYTVGKVLQGSKFAGKYIIEMDPEIRALIAHLSIEQNERIKITRFFDKLYGVASSSGKNLFLAFDPKGNVLYATRKPIYLKNLTPYKRQFFINFLNASGIGYITNGDMIAIKDNMSNWIKAMNHLHTLTKYHNAVYGIYDGQNFFEITDSSYQKSPITVELIDWIPGGKREYNIYSHRYHRKIDTNKRFYDFYLPDGSKKYVIRFY